MSKDKLIVDDSDQNDRYRLVWWLAEDEDIGGTLGDGETHTQDALNAPKLSAGDRECVKDFEYWLLVSLGVLAVVIILGALAFEGLRVLDKRECHASGGKVDHYDDKHEGYWRCVKQAEVAP